MNCKWMAEVSQKGAIPKGKIDKNIQTFAKMTCSYFLGLRHLHFFPHEHRRRYRGIAFPAQQASCRSCSRNLETNNVVQKTKASQ